MTGMDAQTQSLDDTILALAKLVASGESFLDGIAALKIPVEQARAIILEPAFQVLVRANLPTIESVREKFIAQASRASSVVAELMDTVDKPEVRLAAAKDILDRAGLVPVKRIESVRFVFDASKQKQIRETILEAESSSSTGIEVGEIVEMDEDLDAAS